MCAKRFTGMLDRATPKIIRETFYAMASHHGSAAGLTFVGGNNSDGARLCYNYAAAYIIGGLKCVILRVLFDDGVYIPISSGRLEPDIRYCTLSQLGRTITMLLRDYDRVIVELGCSDVPLLAAVARCFDCRIVTPGGFSPTPETLPKRKSAGRAAEAFIQRIG